MRNPRMRRGRAKLEYSSTDAKSGRTAHVTAAAQMLHGPKIKREGRRDQKAGSSLPWQSDVWELYDLIGELWYGINWLGNAASRARLIAAVLPAGGQEPVALDDGVASDLVTDFAGGPAGQSQFLARAGVHLTAVGDSYFVGRTVVDEPDDPLDKPPVPGPGGPSTGLSPIGTAPAADAEPAEQEWCAYSTDEVAYDSGTWRISDGAEQFEIGENDVIMRCWRPHPRRHYEAQSPVRPALPVLRELRGLTMHVQAQIDSRLAGAGILFVPQEMTFPTGQGAQGGDATEGEDPFIRDLLDAMLTPIKDRESAAAVVPLVVKVPADTIGKIQYITFSTPLDDKAKDLRDEALRRFALGMDMPPEIILGIGGETNHWSAWQIDESSIKLHVEPLLATICMALTVGWLRPALKAAGIENADDHVVWFDTTELRQRPNQAAEALNLHDRFAISDAALRRESGFGDEDAPTPVELLRMVLLSVAKQGGDLAPLLRALNVPAETIAAITGQPAADGTTTETTTGTEPTDGGRELPTLPTGELPGGDGGAP